MPRMPHIAITSRESWITASDRFAHGVQTPYLHAIQSAGGIPLIIPLTQEPLVLQELYELSDGILFPGGEDVAPRHYGESPEPDLGEVSELRDEVELLLAEWALRDHKPMLGICRGLQLLNVALGGTLHQDLKTGYPHCNITEGPNRWITLAHEIEIEKNTLLHALIGADKVRVNTLHHQAPKVVAPKLRVNARSVPDGVIEGVEWADEEQDLLALQCHPEGLTPDVDVRWSRCFEWLIERARRWHGDR